MAEDKVHTLAYALFGFLRDNPTLFPGWQELELIGPAGCRVTRQHVIHASVDKRGVERLHAHVVVPPMARDRERPFTVYPKDTQHTHEVAQRETERIFGLERERDRQPATEPRFEIGLTLSDRDIPFHDR